MTDTLPVDPTFTYPPQGYLFPLLPKGFFRPDAPNARALLGVMDGAHGLDGARLGLLELKRQHLWRYATGDNVDDLGALIGLKRFFKGLPNEETDDQFRKRMQAFCRYGPIAHTLSGMATFINAALDVLVIVQDTTDGHFQVNVLGNTPFASQIMPMVRSVKAAGMTPSGYIYSSRPNVRIPVRAGEARAGDVTAGNRAIVIPLL